jgi:hypothetical protein
MKNIQDKLGDLSWLGQSYADQGWVKVEGTSNEPVQPSQAHIAWAKAKQMLRDSDWSVLPDVPMNNETREEWKEYRSSLREIRSQSEFPENIVWPNPPE